MKKISILIVLAFAVVLLVPMLSACGSSSPQRLIVGEWVDEEGEIVWVFQDNGSFRERGGGLVGTYEVISNNTLDMFALAGLFEESFTWAGNSNNVGSDEWFVTRNHLYIDGDVFTRR